MANENVSRETSRDMIVEKPPYPVVLNPDGTLKPWFRGVRFPVLPTVYDDALSYLEAIEKISFAVSDVLRYIMELGDNLNDAAQDYTDEEIAKVKEYFQQLVDDQNQAIEDSEDRMKELYNQIVLANTELTVRVNQLYAAWDAYQGKVDGRIELLYQQLKDYVDSLVVSGVTYVINPVTGQMDTLQNTLDMIWRENSPGALTAAEYDSMQLTAIEYDEIQITAFEYDTHARWYTQFFQRLYFMMISPFTGLRDTVQNIIYKLADLHKKALTAEEYDALELTAEEYDGKNVTAYQYDWNGLTLM